MEPKEYRLYHYTKDMKTVELILRGGFWPRYCAEDFSWMVGNPKPRFLFTPMVCFCDIPIDLSTDHRHEYGDYAIGLSKDWGKSKGVTPVLYVYEEGPIAKHLRKFKRLISKEPLNKSEFLDIWHLLPYLKPVTGTFPNGRGGMSIKDFDEEMEWRYVPRQHADELFTDSVYKNAIDRIEALNQKTKNSMLDFESDDVERVVVATMEEKHKLGSVFPDLTNRIYLWDDFA